MARILVIDNYDSFVYNLVQYLGELGADPLVVRNDSLSIDEAVALKPDAVLLSPGPGLPENAGILCESVISFAGRVPILGVCLGHQAIGYAFGARVVRAPELVHGKSSEVFHHGEGVFAGLDSPLVATRYHSLVIEPSSLPTELEITALTSDGIIMGLRHRSLEVEGVQFHPESILTTAGHDIMRTFVERANAHLTLTR
ncbi:MAG: aminodeoxychorismate/anthranilate synthase component II [Ilumatobacteraceae bacterium]